MNSPRITYAPRPDATPAGEVAALTSVYAFLLDSAKKRGCIPNKSGPDDAKVRSSDDSCAATILPD
jgi:hypothetical protein